MIRFLPGASLLVLVGCASARPFSGEDPSVLATSSIEVARSAAVEGDFARADELLRDADQTLGDAPERREIPYWRALLRLDPRSTFASTTEATQLLDEYLGDPAPAQYLFEAVTLRRIARTIDSLTVAAAAESIALAQRDTIAASREREGELERENARLREALEKSNAELERIRRRIATPPQP